MDNGNFNDTPQSKVGTMGALFIKKRLEELGFELLPTPVVYPSGGSPVDQTIKYSQALPNKKKYTCTRYAEYMTRRQKTYRDVQTFYMDADKWHRIIKLSEENCINTVFYVVDVSKDFNPAIKEIPHIRQAFLYDLQETCTVNGVDFPVEDEQEVFVNGEYVTKKFVYFPVKAFLCYFNERRAGYD